jgi:hypothetical protein
MTHAKTLFEVLAILTVCLAGTGQGHSQGSINFINGTPTAVRTNSFGLGGTAGPTAPTVAGFYYGLFIAQSTVTSLSPLDLLTPTWTFTGVYATNSAGPGVLYGGTSVPVPGWDDTTNSFVVAGWSAAVAQADWNSVSQQLAGAILTNGVWYGPNWLPGPGQGFFGVSVVGFGEAPGPTAGRGPFTLFGLVPTPQGTPVPGFDLFAISTPEPSALALLVSAGLALLARRGLWNG